MYWRQKLLSLVFIICIIVIATGCKTVDSSTIQIINDKEKISAVIINKGDSYQKKFTDTDMIAKIIDNLNNVKVKETSPVQHEKIVNALKKDSPITISLLNDNESNEQSMVILLSEKELYHLPNAQDSKYVVSFINNSDKTTLESIKAIYSIVEKNTSSKITNYGNFSTLYQSL
ncbi:MAG: hypothetical protein APF81_24435 [Desulfosporosinus sp. BRH_c37]|nr:MAG: hypothetical protein APF81_24435 [Desulfosporosinus sp. BRH_c37]